jgi:hypothetical protein
VLVPTDAISISRPSANQRTLDYTHITWNGGAGPLEIHPQFNPTTGQAMATQALSTRTGPATWSVVGNVPIVKPMTWDPPSDYRFPLTSFGLYSNTASGTVGTQLATSPKVDFCMTPDTFVKNVPDATPTGTPSPSNCTDPNGELGISVGWGDLYDHEDAGNNIDISNLPDGTYWLRAQADPGNYFIQSGPNQSVTDTQLRIQGTTVTVLQQVNPTPTRPAILLASPKVGASLTGPTLVQAAASDSVAITSFQFLVDGLPFGQPIAVAPYQTTISGLAPGTHVISAQAVDANGFVGTAPGVTVTVPVTVGSIVIDRTVNANANGHVDAPPVDTTAAGETLVALVGADASGPGQSVTVSGGGLSWTRVQRANTREGDSEIWTATVANATTGIGVSADSTQPGEDVSLTVLAVQNAVPGASASGGAASGAPSVSVTATAAGSMAVAVGNDFDHATSRTLGSGQALVSQWLAPTGDTYWSQYTTTPTTAAGQVITLNDTAPTADQWNFAALELRPTTPPASAASDQSVTHAVPAADVSPAFAVGLEQPTSGQSVTGTIDVTATTTDPEPMASVQFLLDGLPIGPAQTAAPYTVSWNTVTALPGRHTLAATATDVEGRTATSPAVAVSVANRSVCFVKDVDVSAHGSGAITSPGFRTGLPDELLLAMVAYDGPASGGQQTTVSGSGLTWQLVKRADSGHGVTEIWSATTRGSSSAFDVTATPALSGFDGFLHVVALQGADGLGATVASSGANGSPSVALTTTQPQSLVFAVGSADDGPSVSVGSNQVLDSSWSDAANARSFWAQNTSVQTGAGGSVVTVDDAVPSTGAWNLLAVEVVSTDTAAYAANDPD